MTKDTQPLSSQNPLDDRDVAPWAEDNSPEDNSSEEEDGDEERAYQQEREAQRMEEHFAPSQPW